MTKTKRLTVEEILALHKYCEETYYGGLFETFKKDEQYYELDFYELLMLPTEFVAERVILPTGRDFVDSWVDNTTVSNVKVFLNKLGINKRAEEANEMMRKFYLGLLHVTEVENSLSQWQISKKHLGLHGLSVIKTVWDADRWLDKPERNEDESEKEYGERIDEWRSEHHQSMPIIIKALNPAWIIRDPFEEGGQFVFETQERLVYNVKNKYPHWSNPLGTGITGKVKHISFWTPEYRCELYDGEPVLKTRTGCVDHRYGFIPYTFIESGLGNISSDNDPKTRYVGVLRYIRETLVSESRNYSLSDIALKNAALQGGVLEGDLAQTVGQLTLKFGEFTALPKGVTLKPAPQTMIPNALRDHLAITASYLSAHAAPNSVRGLSEPGVRSGVDRQQIMAAAAIRYVYASHAYQNGISRVLTNCAKLVKNVIPGNFKMWARTPTDEIDVEIDKTLMKEPFTCYVQFSPVDEEDEYRRQQARILLVKEGIVTRKWARQQMNNVDPEGMEIEQEIEKLDNDPNLNNLFVQHAMGKAMAALQALSAKESIDNPPPAFLGVGATGQPSGLASPPDTQSATPVLNTQTTTPMQTMNPLGSPQNIENQMQIVRRQLGSGSLQGIGGGGNRH